MLASFRWILPGRLAGSARPGLLADLDQEMGWLRDSGFTTVVTLTESALEPSPSRWGLRAIHFPIADMGTPMPEPTRALCEDILAERGAVLVHCKGGMGRTGTVLACCLVSLGRTPEQAIAEVRRFHPGYVQNTAQEWFVRRYAQHLQGEARAEVGR